MCVHNAPPPAVRPPPEKNFSLFRLRHAATGTIAAQCGARLPSPTEERLRPQCPLLPQGWRRFRQRRRPLHIRLLRPGGTKGGVARVGGRHYRPRGGIVHLVIFKKNRSHLKLQMLFFCPSGSYIRTKGTFRWYAIDFIQVRNTAGLRCKMM